jgi:septal ring factor EnvC (AmiA/AmiB activator)
MNYRQPLAAALALYLICIAPQSAAADESPLSPPQVTIEELRTRLNLTPQQQEQIAPLVEERKAKMEPIRAKVSSTASRREKIAAFQEAKAVQDDFNSKVQPLLSQEQQAEWNKIREEMRGRMKERRRNR